MEYKTFGDFIRAKREAQGITIRKMADRLELSAAYYNDIEKNRRNAFDIDRLHRIASILGLNESEKNLMLNLAGSTRNAAAPDLQPYIMERDYVSAALRTARDLGAGEEEWLQFVEELKRRKG